MKTELKYALTFYSSLVVFIFGYVFLPVKFVNALWFAYLMTLVLAGISVLFELDSKLERERKKVER